MRIAITEWEGRVAPVFDAARRLAVVEMEDGRETAREHLRLTRTDPSARASECAASGVDVLICGAISAVLEANLVSSGVTVIGFVRGDIDHVLGAYAKGELGSPAFFLPGCGRRCWGIRERLTTDRGRGAGSDGRAGGGRGGGGRRHRMGGQSGRDGDCVCPQCGHRMVHSPGQPCGQMQCPKCGAPMARD